MAQGKKTVLTEQQVKQLEMLAGKFWTYEEIAAFFNLSARHIKDRFSDLYRKGREKGKATLRDQQLKAAMNGNVTMLIWLGKQYLDQSERVETFADNEIRVVYEAPTPILQEVSNN